jgi:predicted peroxiredoxin
MIMAEKKTILYVLTSGIDTPERTYSPFVLATTARAMGIDATVYFLGRGVTVVKTGEADRIKLGEFPRLSDVIGRAVEAGVKLMVCDQSSQLLGLDRGDYIDAADVVGAATLNDLALDADAILSF